MRRLAWLSLILTILILNASPTGARGIYSTSYQRIYTVRQIVTIKNSGGRAWDLLLKVPIFMDEAAPPYQRLLSFNCQPQKIRVAETPSMSTLEYRQSSLEKGSSIRLEINYRLINTAIEYELTSYAGQGSSEEKYLNPEPGVESDQETLVKLARSLTEYQPYQLGKAKKLFEYVNHHLEYRRETSLEHSAWQTWKRGWGSCEDFSLLYIALCRAVGIPARLVSGHRFDSTTIGSDWVDLEKFGHAWVEVNLPVLGWIPVDPTYVYTVNGEKQVNYDFFGKIIKDDTHLFFNYLRQSGSRSTFRNDPKKPAQIEIQNQFLIHKG